MPKLKKKYEIDGEEDIEEEDEMYPEEEEQEKPRTVYPKKEKKMQKRYGIIPAQPPRIVDTESNEILAEGDYLIPQALSDIIERLERIESQIGNIARD